MSGRTYNWIVVLRNDEMGFQKRCGVTAETWRDAVHAANRRLERKGYNPLDFTPVEVTRGTALL